MWLSLMSYVSCWSARTSVLPWASYATDAATDGGPTCAAAVRAVDTTGDAVAETLVGDVAVLRSVLEDDTNWIGLPHTYSRAPDRNGQIFKEQDRLT